MAKEEIIKKQIEAAKYAGVVPRTIRRWEEEGLQRGKEGYSKSELDKYKANKGRPQKKVSVTEIEILADEVDVAITALTNLKFRLNQILNKRCNQIKEV